MPSRRQFVVRFAKALFVYATGLLESGRARAAPAAPASPLSARQRETLRAATERIFPRDEEPGANDLGAHLYIEVALRHPDLAILRTWLVALLDGVDADAQRLHRRAFADLRGDEADAILSSWQKGDERHAYAFGLLHTMTLEGLFGDPRHGGNRDGRGHALVGYTPTAKASCR